MNDQMQMPREVAVEMLSDPRAQLSNRMRKNCRKALERPVEVDGAAGYSSGRSKLSGRSMAQLMKWSKRVNRKTLFGFRMHKKMVADPHHNAEQCELVYATVQRWMTVQLALGQEIKSRIKEV